MKLDKKTIEIKKIPMPKKGDAIDFEITAKTNYGNSVIVKNRKFGSENRAWI